MKILVGETEYIDDGTIRVNKMLAHMKSYNGPSFTACPSPEAWADEFRKSDCTLAVSMTSALSGTYNSAMIAKRIVLEESPEKKIHVVDSHSAAGSLVLILNKAADLIEAGLDFASVVKVCEEYVQTLSILFTLSSYDNLMKTGRMSRIAGLLANTLKIRAVASNTPEGKIEIVQKPRGENRALHVLVDLMNQRKNMVGKPVIISHCNNPEGAVRLKDLIVHSCMTTKITVLQTLGLTSFYAENGGLLVAF